MDNEYLSYLSVVGFFVAPARSRFLIANRNSNDEFHPKELALPGGRVKGNESVLGRLANEYRAETGMPIDTNKAVYLNDWNFLRGGIPVIQLGFGIVTHSETVILGKSDGKLVNPRFVTLNEFYREQRDSYFAQVEKFARRAIEIGLLKS